jgi:hypothetical protein
MRIAQMNRRRRAVSLATLAALGLLSAAALRFGASDTVAQAPDEKARAEKSIAAFMKAYAVFQHPRCMNCHPSGDRPLQGDDSHPHAQNVKRGVDGKGLYALKCAACHQEENLPGEHMPPGAKNWHLPTFGTPLVFEGRSASDLAEQMKDRARNGEKSLEGVVHHVEHDALVLWGMVARRWPRPRPRHPRGVRPSRARLGGERRGHAGGIARGRSVYSVEPTSSKGATASPLPCRSVA